MAKICLDGPAGAVIGRPHARIDGPLKVTGSARYSAEIDLPGLLHAVPVGATVASGTVTGIDISLAERMPGVRAVFRRGDLPPLMRVAERFPATRESLHLDEKRPPFEDDEVGYWGQFVALAVADTLEEAKAAADAVRVDYAARSPELDADLRAEQAKVVSARGDVDAALSAAEVVVDHSYVTGTLTHNPMEMHVTIAEWAGDELTLHESSQGVVNHRNVVADMLRVPRDKVRVVSRFVGSGFGSKLFPWTLSSLTAAAAKALGLPIKCVLTRAMMFHVVGQRPRVVQRVALGARRDGTLTGFRQDYINATSMLDDYDEPCGELTPSLYAVADLRITSGAARRNIGSPTSMRAPGAGPGLFAVESAMDELAVALDVDPIALRLRNEPAVDEAHGVPFTSRHLAECLTVGAERFGWSRRDARPGSMRHEDGSVLGWGVASAIWLGSKLNCEVSVELRDDGTARVGCATQDIGTGTYTILAQLAAERLGLAVGEVEVALGDTRLPAGAQSGGSMLTASLVDPVFEAIDKAGLTLAQTAAKSPLFAQEADDGFRFEAGHLVPASGHGPSLSFADALRRLRLGSVLGHGAGKRTYMASEPAKASSNTFAAQFCEVSWRPEIARLHVTRMTSIVDAGRVLNPLAARNQIEGAAMMGIGMALLEETQYDPRFGNPVNADLADYMMMVNADAPAFDVHFVDHPDTAVNALGAKGLGEIGLIGTAAAVANAIHHATGIRLRTLPIRLEHLMGAPDRSDLQLRR